ncbi:MAG: prolyl oligopeptidase family serine peptidase [Acidobacteriota bacterium]|nr:prolyl oligopeptidase family serine peptidase [Blastocatellia bacterium]MDW8411431.1 prolyl oligopeptidase family serine peptidase [Acidobacteriota bacterium]
MKFGIPILTLLILVCGINAQQLKYPVTKQVEHYDIYHGIKVADPYRWLEDDNSPETARWIEEQNRLTFSYLEQIPFRKKLQERMEQVFNYPKYSSPFRKGELFFFFKNDGLQNQSVLYMQKGLDGSPEVLLDPNKFSDDGTARLAGFTLSKDGRYAAYGISRGGSDWQVYQVLDTATRKTLSDKVEWVKISSIGWKGNGFFYSRYPAPERELSSKNENHKVYYHRIGTSQDEDELVYEDPANPQRFNVAFTTEDERFLILSISDRGKGKDGNALYFRDLDSTEKTFKPLIAEIGDYRYSVIDNIDDKFIVETNDGAPNGHIVLIDSKNPDRKNWRVLIPQQPQPLKSASSAGGKLFLTYFKDVKDRVYVYSLEGKREREVKLPGLGNAAGFSGEKDDKFIFYTFTSFTSPPTIYRYDIATGKSTVFRTSEVNFNPNDYITKQVFYPSKDGVKVPMFIVHRKGIKLDGNNPTLLYGYGGFNISLSPSFNALLIPFLEQGGVYAVANLRGGGEYGEDWHKAGMRLKKQNVFNDFIAAAEYLIKEKYTSSKRLAIRGGSNGGLLVGACINQRPELFAVAIPQVGVMDMLRFHKFTIGWNWIAEYGSSDNEEDFKNLYAYSPLHNIKEQNYPATLITTADHDDRVVPAHSFKYAATLQQKQRSRAPILIRISTKSGHGASNTRKAIEENADIMAFIFYNLGVQPKF